MLFLEHYKERIIITGLSQRTELCAELWETFPIAYTIVSGDTIVSFIHQGASPVLNSFLWQS